MAVTAIARLAQLRSIIGVLELAQQKTHADTASIQHNHHLVELLASGGILGDAPATGGSAWAPVADAVIQLLELLERLACKAEVRYLKLKGNEGCRADVGMGCMSQGMGCRRGPVACAGIQHGA